MAKIGILNSALLDITTSRLCKELIENHNDFRDSVLLGLQPRGVFFAHRIQEKLLSLCRVAIPLGYLDTTFYRDDFRRRPQPIKPNATNISFLVEDKKVILVDDVLYTGRTVRAAMSAMMAFGRPKKVELLVLVDRKYQRDLPIQPNYIGKSVNTIQSQRVLVQWKDQGFAQDNIWLIQQEEEIF